MYAYVGDNPTSVTDPSGLDWVTAGNCSYDIRTIYEYTWGGTNKDKPSQPTGSFNYIAEKVGQCGGIADGDLPAPLIVPDMTFQYRISNQMQVAAEKAQQKRRKNPCAPLANNLQGTPAPGVDTVFDVFGRALHPLDMIAVNGTMFVAAGGHALVGFLAVSGGCLEPTPWEPATCAGGIALAAATAPGAVVSGAIAVKFFKDVTLPAIKEWGCHE